jgi:hypothetical protein
MITTNASRPWCADRGWVCEEHPGQPGQGEQACSCGAAGMSCPRCNTPAEGEQPGLPEGFKTEFDKDGWCH